MASPSTPERTGTQAGAAMASCTLCLAGHAAGEGVALSHLVEKEIWEVRELNLDEAKALEKAVGVHRETNKCPRKDVPG